MNEFDDALSEIIEEIEIQISLLKMITYLDYDAQIEDIQNIVVVGLERLSKLHTNVFEIIHRTYS